MEQNERKGQGALEYLLLIGGAVVVAAVVVVLILNLGATNQAQTDTTSAGALCAQLATTAGNATPSCTDVNALAGSQAKIRNNRTSTCYVCSGAAYPNCTAARTAGTFGSVGNCASADVDYAVIN